MRSSGDCEKACIGNDGAVSLPELVAYDEGLFAKEGLQIEWADREAGVAKKIETNVTNAERREPFREPRQVAGTGQGRHVQRLRMGQLLPRSGNRPRQPAARPSRHRRLRGYHGAADSPVYTPQQLANRAVGVPFYFGTHYLALHLLEGFLPREMIKLCRAPNGSSYRFDAMMRGELEATPLTEPYITLAEKKGCRSVCSAFFHGTEVAERVDGETYAAFNRAVREAVRRINANKKAYLHYFIDYYAARDPEIAALKVEDLRESRLVVCDPTPIPLDEMQRTYDWLKSWGMLEETASPLALVNLVVQNHAHQAAE